MKFICSLIVVEDVLKSRTLYEKILNQKVTADFGENVAFEGGFAIHQKSHYKKLINEKPIQTKSNSFELYFEHDEVIDIQNILKREGFEFVHEVREQPWRQMVLRFYDYDNNIIEIGETMEHVAYRLFLENKDIEEIAKITYLDREKIVNSINSYKEK